MTERSFPRVRPDVRLRDVVEADLPVFFEMHRDPQAGFMAAFTSKDPSDHAAFMSHWDKIRANSENVTRSVVCEDVLVGNVVSFMHGNRREIGYWIVREHWGRGIATAALSLLLSELTVRPLYAGAAKDNLRSIRVLKKCGFKICRYGRAFANARGKRIDEVLLKLVG